MIKEIIFAIFLIIALIAYIKLSSIKILGRNLINIRYRILLALLFPLIIIIFLFLGFIFAIVILLILIIIFIFWIFTPRKRF